MDEVPFRFLSASIALLACGVSVLVGWRWAAAPFRWPWRFNALMWLVLASYRWYVAVTFGGGDLVGVWRRQINSLTIVAVSAGIIALAGAAREVHRRKLRFVKKDD